MIVLCSLSVSLVRQILSWSRGKCSNFRGSMVFVQGLCVQKETRCSLVVLLLCTTTITSSSSSWSSWTTTETAIISRERDLYCCQKKILCGVPLYLFMDYYYCPHTLLTVKSVVLCLPFSIHPHTHLLLSIGNDHMAETEESITEPNWCSFLSSSFMAETPLEYSTQDQETCNQQLKLLMYHSVPIACVLSCAMTLLLLWWLMIVANKVLCRVYLSLGSFERPTHDFSEKVFALSRNMLTPPPDKSWPLMLMGW